MLLWIGGVYWKSNIQNGCHEMRDGKEKITRNLPDVAGKPHKR